MRTKILATALLTLSGAASAAPSLIASVDRSGGVSFEFVADKAQPVAAFNIELPLKASKTRIMVPEQCLSAPMGFTALCNVDNNVFKAVVFSTNPDAAAPSAALGRVVLPAGAVSMLKSGEVSGLKLNAADSAAKIVVGEVLSETASVERTAPSRQK